MSFGDKLQNFTNKEMTHRGKRIDGLMAPIRAKDTKSRLFGVELDKYSIEVEDALKELGASCMLMWTQASIEENQAG